MSVAPQDTNDVVGEMDVEDMSERSPNGTDPPLQTAPNEHAILTEILRCMKKELLIDNVEHPLYGLD